MEVEATPPERLREDEEERGQTGGAADERRVTGGAVEDKRKNRGMRHEWVTKPRWVMKPRWHRGLCSITGPRSDSPLPSPFLPEPPPLLLPRGTTPALPLYFISSDHIHAA